ARGGIERNDALAALVTADVGAEFFDGTGEFVSEQGRRNNHASVVTALIDHEVRAASEGNVDLDQDLDVTDTRDRYRFDLDVLFSVEDSSCHMSVHSDIPSQTLPGWMAIFIVSG